MITVSDRRWLVYTTSIALSSIDNVGGTEENVIMRTGFLLLRPVNPRAAVLWISSETKAKTA